MTQHPTATLPSTADLCLPATPVAPGQARRTLAALTCHPQIREDGRLLVTEAVANVVEHTDATQVHVLLRHEPDDSRLFCAVRDTSSAVPAPQPDHEPDLGNPGGRGLHLIDALAEAWGYLPDESGKWLWFSLTPTDPATAAA